MSQQKALTYDFFRMLVQYHWIARYGLGCLVGLILLNGILFSFVENQDLGSSIYFACITGLTIGYGDIAPETTFGRIIAVLIGILGTLFVGLLVAINTRALAETVKKRESSLGM